MRSLTTEVLVGARTWFGPPRSAADPDRNDDSGGCPGDGGDCVWSLVARACHRLRVRGIHGSVVEELRGWPGAYKIARWIRSIDRSISWRRAKRMATEVFVLNDLYQFNEAWAAVEPHVRQLVAASYKNTPTPKRADWLTHLKQWRITAKRKEAVLAA